MLVGGARMLSIMFMFFLIIFATTIQPSRAGLWMCNTGNNYTQGSPIIQNLQNVLGVLANETASSKKGYHTSVYGQSPNTVYAMAMCRGDQTETQCRVCLQDAATSLQRACGLMPGGRVMSAECFLRRENYSNFTTNLDESLTILYNVNDASNTSAFSPAVSVLFQDLIEEALQTNNSKRYASGKAAVDSIHNVYGVVQCWGDIDNSDCKDCLAVQYDKIGRNATKQGSIGFTGNCMAEYENHKFFTDIIVDSPPPAMSRIPHSISHNRKLGFLFNLVFLGAGFLLV